MANNYTVSTTSTGWSMTCTCNQPLGPSGCSMHGWTYQSPQYVTSTTAGSVTGTSVTHWPLPFTVEEVEIDDAGMVTVYGPGRRLLGSISAKALRRLVDVGVLDGFR